jgi:putative flippase GtrA
MTSLQKVFLYASSTEFLRYFWAGSLTFLADFLLLIVLTELVGINYLWSNLAAVSVGMVLGYLLCITWVFQNRRYTRVVLEFPLFVLICIAGILLNETLLWACVEFGKTHYLVAKVIVTVFVFVFNFFLKKMILFCR